MEQVARTDRRGDNKMKIGTVGSGSIVEKVVGNLLNTGVFECQAVYSRTIDKGSVMAERFKAPKVYLEYDKMLLDEAVDVVYIASPNGLHFQQAKEALEHGKHVLCEKPFTSILAEALELAAIARERQLMLVEAVTTAYIPHFQKIAEHLPEIGRIRLVMCNYSQYSSRYDQLLAGKVTNVFNPEFSGGALMDINFYNLYLVVALFGKPAAIQYFANRFENGIDTSGIAVLTYPDFICQCTGAKDTWGENFVQIEGEKGYIYIEGGANGCPSVKVVTKDTSEHIKEQPNGDQWYYETLALAEIFGDKNMNECDKLLEKSLEVIETLEKARASAGIVFPADK